MSILLVLIVSQEYSYLVDFLQVGIQGETQEKQVEMTVFILCA